MFLFPFWTFNVIDSFFDLEVDPYTAYFQEEVLIVWIRHQKKSDFIQYSRVSPVLSIICLVSVDILNTI